MGFDGTYFPKPDSPCIYIKENNGPDGCAIFYRLNTFEVVRVETHIVEVWRVQSNQVPKKNNSVRFTFLLSLQLQMSGACLFLLPSSGLIWF